MEELTLHFWKAHEYRMNPVEDLPQLFGGSGNKGKETLCVEAPHNTSWKPISPVEFYRPSEDGRREAKAGPHLAFLRLKNMVREQPHLLEKGIVLFAQEYGLLGIFQNLYLTMPVLRRGKLSIAPEAVQDGAGALKKVEPATEGIDLLVAKIRENLFFRKLQDAFSEETFRRSVALPEEVRFTSPHSLGQSRKTATSWTEIQREFGALFVLTPWGGVFPLCTREPLRWWRWALDNFPTPREVATNLRTTLRGVQPVFKSAMSNGFYPEGAEDSLSMGWECDSLLSAMHLMLCLDLSGGSTIRRCQSEGCPQYFRAGPYSRAKYCSSRCASRVSTRLSRSREF